MRDEVARRGGDPNCRESLQDLGQRRIEQGAEAFSRKVLAAAGFVPGEDFVLEGVRHRAVLRVLGRIAAPSEVRLIFLRANLQLRSKRVRRRSDTAREDFDRAAHHVVEAETEHALPATADAIVDSSRGERVVVEECIRHINRWRYSDPRAHSFPEIIEHADGRWRK